MSLRAKRNFARYAAASTAALGAATATKAQFTGNYSLTSPSPASGTFSNAAAAGTFGVWTSTRSGTTSVTTSSGASLTLFGSTNPSVIDAEINFTSIAAATGTVSFDYNTSVVGSDAHNFWYTQDGAAYTLITGASTSSSFNFAVTSGATFGFRVSARYTYNNSMSATLTNFSAPSAIPEAAATTLLAGVAALGFVGLMAVRKQRQPASAQSAR